MPILSVAVGCGDSKVTGSGGSGHGHDDLIWIKYLMKTPLVPPGVQVEGVFMRCLVVLVSWWSCHRGVSLRFIERVSKEVS